MPVAIDPFAAKSKAAPAGEKESTLTTFLRRLRLLGASDEMVEDVRANWDNFDDQWTPEFRARFTRKSDPDLREHVRAVAEEWVSDTTDGTAQHAAERDARMQAALAEAEGIIGGNVASVIDWVGDSPVRAWAAYRLEYEEYGAGRKSLLAALGPLSDQWTADASRA